MIYESTVINEYLQDEYPHPPLLPDDSATRARVRMLEDYCDNLFMPPAAILLFELHKAEAERDQQRIEQSRDEIQRCLAYVNHFLGSAEYLGGTQFSLADAGFAPRAVLLNRLSIEVDASLTAVELWIGRLKVRPSVRALELV